MKNTKPAQVARALANLALLLFLVGCASAGGPSKKKRLVAPYPSSIAGVSIANAHIVARDKGFIARGMIPYEASEVQSLKNIGVTDVLIFRNDNSNESGVKEEVELLNAQGYKTEQIHHIAFPWRDIKSFEIACRQTIEALQLLMGSLQDSRKGLYFHCTVGEDRTGYLAGLYRVLAEGVSVRDAFKNEMCARGYAESDKTKPAWVSELVHKNITTQYLQMVALFKYKKVDAKKLDPQICVTTNREESRHLKAALMGLESFHCRH